jgi:hypothetical protein
MVPSSSRADYARCIAASCAPRLLKAQASTHQLSAIRRPREFDRRELSYTLAAHRSRKSMRPTDWISWLGRSEPRGLPATDRLSFQACTVHALLILTLDALRCVRSLNSRADGEPSSSARLPRRSECRASTARTRAPKARCGPYARRPGGLASRRRRQGASSRVLSHRRIAN